LTGRFTLKDISPPDQTAIFGLRAGPPAVRFTRCKGFTAGLPGATATAIYGIVHRRTFDKLSVDTLLMTKRILFIKARFHFPAQ